MPRAYRFEGLIIEPNGDEYSRHCVIAVADIEDATKLARQTLGDPFLILYRSISDDQLEALQLKDGEARLTFAPS